MAAPNTTIPTRHTSSSRCPTFRAIRLTILSLTFDSLAIACFNSTLARFAVILRNRANSTTTDGHGDFKVLQQELLESTTCMAVFAAIFTIFGAAITAHPTYLQDHTQTLVVTYALIQLFMAVSAIYTGVFVASQVRRFHALFTEFGASERVAYYALMYSGGVINAVHGSLAFLAIFAIVAYSLKP